MGSFPSQSKQGSTERGGRHKAGCIWYLLSSDSPGHTFIRAARCYNITPIWPGSNRRPYRPAWSPQRVGGFKFCPHPPPQGLSLGFLASSLQGPLTPKTGSDVRAALENIGNPGRKILCSLPVGRRRRVVQAACPPCVAVPQLGRTSTAGPTLLVEAAPTHDLFYCETRDHLPCRGHQASLSVVSQQRRQLSTPCEGVRSQT